MDNIENMCLGELASVFYRQYQAYINREMKDYGINFSECEFLIKIPNSDEIIQRELAESLICDNAIVTRSLQKLEKKELIKRINSTEDKRAILVSLTDRGRDIKKIGLEKRRFWKNSIMEDVPEEEKQLVFQFFKAMVNKALIVNSNFGGEKDE
ncbi:MAG: MarR family transcriptional regulator [Tissierellia bacterium]|nr:MarR family transcriptional regulator [Tissierellia bacterium]